VGFLMKHQRNFVLALLSVLLFGDLVLANAQAAEKRIALVVGNANYFVRALPTPANDAGLSRKLFRPPGFRRGRSSATLIRIRCADIPGFYRQGIRSGSDTVSFIYLSGYGLQLEAKITSCQRTRQSHRDVNVSSEALRLSDYTKPLAALGIKVSIVVLDGARARPFAKSGPPLASGLALSKGTGLILQTSCAAESGCKGARRPARQRPSHSQVGDRFGKRDGSSPIKTTMLT